MPETFREFYQRKHGKGLSERQWFVAVDMERHDDIIERLANTMADFADEVLAEQMRNPIFSVDPDAGAVTMVKPGSVHVLRGAGK